MQKISAIVITLNEEANIVSCLNALLQVAAEVTVVDSGSTDRTKQLAENLGAKVVESEWLGYAATKNFGNQIAAHDWILSIDADEVLSPSLIDSIQKLQLEDRKVYALDRLTNFCGQWIKHSGWYPEWKIRLFHRNYSHWQGEFVHEQLVHVHPVEVKKIKGKLYHYSYKTLEDHWQRIEHYARLSALKIHASGKRSNFIKLWLSPLVRFLKTYLWKRGFLDGKNGWIISLRNARLVHLKYRILQELNKNK